MENNFSAEKELNFESNYFLIKKKYPEKIMLALKTLNKKQLEELINSDDGINGCLEKKHSLFKKNRVRKYFMHKTLKKLLGKGFIFDVSTGDGDAAFT